MRNADLWLAAFLSLAGIYFLSGYFTTVRFEREHIEVRVAPGSLNVTGFYLYRNASRLPAVLTMGVPFPVDRDHLEPDEVSLSEAGRELTFSLRKDFASFRLFFRSGEAKWIRLNYRQPSRVADGRYILTSTRAWRRPIANASFMLSLPKCYALASSNYEVTPRTGQSYVFARTDFYPDADWRFSWRAVPCERNTL